MNVLHVMIAVIGLSSTSVVRANTETESRCPTLPPESGFTWTYKQGPDFGVCYAEQKGTPSAGLIGVYQGFAPDFSPSETTFVRNGRVDGVSVRWHRKTSDTFKFGLEALRKHGGGKDHLWVLADDESKLDALRHIAENLRFKEAE